MEQKQIDPKKIQKFIETRISEIIKDIEVKTKSDPSFFTGFKLGSEFSMLVHSIQEYLFLKISTTELTQEQKDVLSKIEMIQTAFLGKPLDVNDFLM
jgi:hypothetical protein